MLKKHTFICSIALIAFVACAKLKDNTPAPTPSNLSLLTTRNWKFVGESQGSNNTWKSNDTCNADATFTFHPNYTYTYIGCDSSNAYRDSTAGHWAFLNSAQTAIVFHPKAVDADTFQISSITQTILVLSQIEDSTGLVYSETFLNP